jgi:hypothetical protein
MPRSIFSKCALVGALLFSPAVHAAGDIDAMELSRDWGGLIGQSISIRGCTLTSATPKLAVCLVKWKHGRPASFLVDPSGMTPDDMARALRDCSDYVGYPLCRVRLEGEVAGDNGELKIMQGSVSWIVEPRGP